MWTVFCDFWIFLLGEHDTRSKSESNELRLRVRDIIVHDQYEDKKSQEYLVYDFTLLKLSEPVNFELYPHIRPICMPDPKFIETQGDLFTTVGWGHTEVYHLVLGNLTKGCGSSPSDTLQKIDVRYTFFFNDKNNIDFNFRAVELQTCQKTFNGLDIEIRDINMCAKSSLGDTCQGDSGGGLVKKNSNGR